MVRCRQNAGTGPQHHEGFAHRRLPAPSAFSVLLGLKWATLRALPEDLFPVLVISAAMVSRWCATGLIWALRYVRMENDGKARPFADSLSGGEWVLSAVIGAAPIFLLVLTRAGATFTRLGAACALRP